MASGVILGSHQVHLYRSIAGAAPPDALNIAFGGVLRSSCGNRTQTWKPGNRCGNRCGNCWESVGNHGILIILKKRIPIPFLFFNIKNGFQHFSNSFHNGFHNGFQKFGGFHDSSRAQTECTPPSRTFSTSDETSRD